MTFFLIVPSVIIISIIAVHGIANFVGLKIKYGTLFMCAALAFVALFVALELSSNPDKFFFLRLGAVILPSAAILTALNRFLILREKNNEAEFTEEVRREYSKQVEGEVPADTKTSVSEPKPSASDTVKPSIKDNLKPPAKDKPKTSTIDKNVSAEKSFEFPNFDKVKLEKVPAQVNETLPDKKIAKSKQAEDFEKALKAAKNSKSSIDKKVSKPEKVVDFDKILQAAQVDKDLIEESSSDKKSLAKIKTPATENVAEDTTKDIETLESLLEYAKAEKVKGNITATIDAYQKALEDYGNDDYAPFIAIDLSAIYREQAAYTKAIKVYEEALTFPAVKKNPAVEDEFKRKLAYIQTVQAVLLRHRALTTPFSQIPISYMQEIELEFRENSSSEDL